MVDYKKDLNNPFLSKRQRAEITSKDVPKPGKVPEKLQTGQRKKFAPGILTGQAISRDARPKRVGFRFM